MITLYDGRFHTHIDLLDWWLPEIYAGTHFLKQIAARPSTAAEIAAHQAWGPLATAETLNSYTEAGILTLDEHTGRYSLNLPNLIDLLDAAWLKHPQEDHPQEWICADTSKCDGGHHRPVGKRGTKTNGDENGPALYGMAEVAA